MKFQINRNYEYLVKISERSMKLTLIFIFKYFI